MKRSRRLLLASFCVEAVAVASVFAYGYLSLVAVAVVYWIDLLFLAFRVTVQRLIARKTTSKTLLLSLLPFRLLKHKRGSVRVADRLPPVYLRNVPESITSVFVILISVVTTAYVSAVHVPAEFWNHPAVPFVLAGGVVAAAAKSWLILKEHVDAGVHETKTGDAVAPGKRLLLFTVYAVPLYLVSEATVGVLAENGLESVRNGMMFWSLVFVALRLAYGVRASRTRFAGRDDEDEDDDGEGGIVSRLRSKLSGEHEGVAPSPPPIPDGRPFETVEPKTASVLAAGVVNAVTTGGVVDKEFSTRGIELRAGVLLVVPLAVLAFLDGAVVFFGVTVGGLLVLTAVFSAVSAAHMYLALGDVEYRFYDPKMVAYDRRLGEAQWSVPYEDIRDVSVDGGLFGGPLWMGTGTVFFERTDSPVEEELRYQEPRASVPFVSDPERVAEIIQSGGR